MYVDNWDKIDYGMMRIRVGKTLTQIKNTDVVTCILTARIDQNCFIAAFKSEPFSFEKNVLQ